jgi:proteasome lid subunit RPN8/RPN11
MKIRKEVLEALLELSKGAYPNEVGGLLLSNPVNDFVIMPGKFSRNSVNVYMNQLPIYPTLRGTFHSHPSPDNRPSKADLDFFGRLGREHLIIAYPYVLNSTAVYDGRGAIKTLELV